MSASTESVLDVPFPSRSVASDAIYHQVDLLLASSHFRNSKRHQRLLTFLTQKHIDGDMQSLTERVIGIEVFDRKPAYDLTLDPMVRGAMADLRKRLTLYYSEAPHSGELRIEIPVGSYVPHIYWPELEDGSPSSKIAIAKAKLVLDTAPFAVETPSITEIAAEDRRPTIRRYLLAAVVACVCATAIFFAYRASETQKQNRDLASFWTPLLNSENEILICAGTLNGIMHEPVVENDTWNHVTRTRNHLDPNVGAALVSVSSLLGAEGKHPHMRIADTTTLPDLRRQPSILIGGFNNQWTARVQSNMRYRISRLSPDASGVVDTENADTPLGTFDLSAPVNSITKSYAIITRLNDPLTGQYVLSLAGLGPYGNSSAAEFVTTPAYFALFAKQAPKGWESHNIQLVIETSLVEGKASPPKVIAFELD
ncbi:hypothetical protein [Terriglobus albidus]|uniref:hypothetical protein n=1 Tax=Terriglobus albidus TaxID=1592106 RepID=UPI0021DF6E43|nr:hypothetical protein [Terriglobus albidus]